MILSIMKNLGFFLFASGIPQSLSFDSSRDLFIRSFLSH